MNPGSKRVQRIYLSLTLLSTLAASLIWGINTLFLLDAGLSNAQAFAANALFSAGEVLFEVPTGVLADVWGRRASYLLGAATLLVSTLLYLLMWRLKAPMWGWAIASILLGLGFTFFSGATEAWLVDALAFNGFDGSLESVFAKGQTVGGAAMLGGSLAGGFIAQLANLGAPYLVRSGLLVLTFTAAFFFMKDLGFTPVRGKSPVEEIRKVLRASIDNGWRNPPVRWLMLAAPFTTGVTMYAFYALQPHLLALYGDKKAFGIAGLAAAIIAATAIVGGLVTPFLRRLFTRRTHVLMLNTVTTVGCLAVIGLTTHFAVAVAALVIWGMMFAVNTPVRQAYLNGVIPSPHRATILSFDNLMGSAGGVAAQPALGRVADLAGYGRSYLIGALVQLAALPFLVLARNQNAPSDPIAAQEPAQSAAVK
jgi:MFS family permease